MPSADAAISTIADHEAADRRSARTTAAGRRAAGRSAAGAVIGRAVIRAARSCAGRRAGAGAGGRPTGRRRARRWSRAASRRRGPRPGRASRRPRTGARAAAPSSSVRSAADAMCAHRQDEDVGRRLRVDVADRDHEVVLVELRRRDLARDDAAEQAVIGHGRLRASSRAGRVAASVTARRRARMSPRHPVRDVAVDRGSADREDRVLEVVGIPAPGVHRRRARDPPRGPPIGRRAAASPPGRGSPSRGPAARTSRAPPRRARAARPRAPSSSRSSTWPAMRVAGVPGRAEYRKTWRPARSIARTNADVVRERRVVLGREAGDDVGVDGDAGDRRPGALDDARVVRGQVPAAHAPEHAVVARLERQVEVRQRPRRAVDPGREQVVVDVLGLDRAQADPLDVRLGEDPAHEARRA